MAVTGVFQADFSNFTSAVDAAEVKFKTFEQSSGKVEMALSRVTNSLSGTKLIQDATLMVEAVDRVGGVSKLTEKELARVAAQATEAAAKMVAMGIDVPPGLARIAAETKQVAVAAVGAGEKTSIFGASFARLTSAFAAASLIDRAVGSLVGWAGEAFASAAATADLAEKTGLSTDEIQRMAFVADQTGSSVDAFTTASFKLGIALATGNDSAKSAVEALGLSFESLKAARPEEQFNLVMTALGNLSSEQERARLGTVLFGKGFADLAAAAAQGYGEMAAGAVLMSKETIAAADAFDDSWGTAKLTLKALIGETLLFSAEPFIKAAQAMGLMVEQTKKARGDIELTAEAYTDWAGKLAAATVKVDSLTRAQIQQIDIARMMGASAEELLHDFGLTAEAVTVLDQRLRKEADAARDGERAHKALEKGMIDVSNSGRIMGSVIDGIVTATGEAIHRDEIWRSGLTFTTEVIEKQTRAIDEQASAVGVLSENKKKASQDDLTTKSFTTDIKQLTASQLAVFRGGSTGDAGIWKELDRRELEYDPDRKARSYEDLVRMQTEQYLLFQLRMWAAGKTRPAGDTPGFASGVTNFAGGIARVHAGETLVNLPRGTDVIPAGRSGGGGITLNFQVNGTAADTARQIKDIIMRELKMTRQFSTA